MARYLPTSHFFILSFVVVVLCSTLCVAGDGASGEELRGGESGKVSAKLLLSKQEMSSVKGPTNDGPKTITLCKLKLPFLLFAAKDNVMVAVTEAEYTDQSDDACKGGEKVGIVTKYFEAKDNNNDWKKTKIEATIKMWTSQLATNNGQAKTLSTVMTFAVNAEKNKIYVFLLYSTQSTDSTEKWEFKSLCGTISNGGTNSKKIDWQTEEMPEPKLVENVKQKLNEKLGVKPLTLSLADGFAFLMKSGKILFVVKGKSKETNTDSTTEETFTAYFQYDEEKPKELELLSVESTAGWYQSFFEWNGEIYKTPTNTDSDKVMMFSASQSNSFTEINSSPISRLRDFLKDKNNFSAAAIKGGKSVLLFTQEQKHSESGDSKKDIHLWMTDGTRVGYVGTIITGFKDISCGPVLHANNNLFVLHQNYETESGETQQNEFNITLLDGKLDKINNIITTWESNDKKIEGLCKDAFTTPPSCLTDGPVGFLSGNKSGEEWKNEYLNVNAKLSKQKGVRENVQNGFKFSGEGAGAQWLAEEQWQNQPYNFKDSGFTLVATVTIGSSGTSGSHNSIFGVGITNNKKNVGLWCTTSGRWGVKVGDGHVEVTSSAVVCGPDKKYYVALILNGTEVLVYVNGQKLADLKSNKIEGGEKISYFYFGAYDNSPTLAKTDVTITDVLLYNRPFTAEEVEQIKPKQNNDTDSQQKREDEISKLPKPDKNTTEAETESPSSTSATEKEEAAQSSSPPPTTEDSAVRVGVVGVLCFMLFGVFTLLGRYVY